MEKIEPFGYYCAACDGFTTDKRHAELYWNDYGHQPLYSQATVDQLVRELEAWKKKADVPTKYKRMEFNAQLQEQLAATEALCQKYREALEHIRDTSGIRTGTNVFHLEIQTVLATPSPTAALNNAIADELERWAGNETPEMWARIKELREQGK